MGWFTNKPDAHDGKEVAAIQVTDEGDTSCRGRTIMQPSYTRMARQARIRVSFLPEKQSNMPVIVR
jgi:hypothetical protein